MSLPDIRAQFRSFGEIAAPLDKNAERVANRPARLFAQVRWNDGLGISRVTASSHICSPDENWHDREKCEHDEIYASRDRIATGDIIRKRKVCETTLDGAHRHVRTASTGRRSDGGSFGPRPNRTTRSGLRLPISRKVANCGRNAATSTG